MYPDSASKYGLWDVPKAYYHLYGDNTITLDVDTPLDKLGSRTSVQVLQDAFKKHVSQISYSFNMLDSGYAITFNGQFDTRSFGLYRTLVGLDTHTKGLNFLIHSVEYEIISSYTYCDLAFSRLKEYKSSNVPLTG